MICMGPLAILIGINVAHDAAHDAISKHRIINRCFLHLFDALAAHVRDELGITEITQAKPIQAAIAS